MAPYRHSGTILTALYCLTVRLYSPSMPRCICSLYQLILNRIRAFASGEPLLHFHSVLDCFSNLLSDCLTLNLSANSNQSFPRLNYLYTNLTVNSVCRTRIWYEVISTGCSEKRQFLRHPSIGPHDPPQPHVFKLVGCG